MRQRSHLARSPLGHARVIPSRFEAAGGLDEFADRPRDAAKGPTDQDEGEDEQQGDHDERERSGMIAPRRLAIGAAQPQGAREGREHRERADAREDHDREECDGHPPDEARSHLPPWRARRRERLAFGPPWRTVVVPAPAMAHLSSSRKRYPTPWTVCT